MSASRPKKPRLPVPSEHEEQVALFRLALLHCERHPELRWLYAIPNFSGRLGRVPPVAAIRQAQRLNAEGRRAGYPDVGLDVARGGYHGLRIELKRQKGGSVSQEQRMWHDWLTAQGYRVVVANGAEAAWSAITEYLALPPTEVARPP